jgi:hypothetical protein
MVAAEAVAPDRDCLSTHFSRPASADVALMIRLWADVKKYLQVARKRYGQQKAT